MIIILTPTPRADSRLQDERCARLPEFGILEKMFLERILRRPEVEAFASSLRVRRCTHLLLGSLKPLAPFFNSLPLPRHRLCEYCGFYDSVRPL